MSQNPHPASVPPIRDHQPRLARAVPIGQSLLRVRDEIDQLMRSLNGNREPLETTAPERFKLAQSLLAARRRRTSLMPGVCFGEPAWDMLLDLYVSQERSAGLSVSNLCDASGVPATTALRWIALLVKSGHLVKSDDPEDRRRSLVCATPAAIDQLERWLNELLASLI